MVKERYFVVSSQGFEDVNFSILEGFVAVGGRKLFFEKLWRFCRGGIYMTNIYQIQGVKMLVGRESALKE
ncbi:hypothetical protein C5167_043916 [Papaver somniferum]|uniref:Uncharacterized protein n=1 Tax=Papaver somniferum TaxID=3469 RepID=A0A4Y7LAW9_PAPSO|nr:hypothetical protein C5167_043916 [Papaver somniferum]